MRNVVRYSEVFKLRLAEDMAGEKYKSLDEAGRKNGIRGSATAARWIKVEPMDEIDEIKAARRRIRELETASADGTCRRAYGLLP
jgi:hypothetical protein